MAMLQMKRERKRRKRQKVQPLNPTIARKLFGFEGAPSVPVGAGFVRAPVIESDTAGIFDVKQESTEEMIDVLEVEHQEAEDDHKHAEMNRTARAMTGRKARIVNLPGKTS